MNKENQQEQELKNKAEEFDTDTAIRELVTVIQESSDMYQQLKKIKFDFINQTCDLFSRIDMPSMMMDHCRRDMDKNIPNPKNVVKSD